MTTSRRTTIETKMYDKGYASSRMCAFKLKKDFKSVLRQVSRGQFRAVRVGQQQFVEIASIIEWYQKPTLVDEMGAEAGDSAVDLLGLADWSDVFYEEGGLTHVRKDV